MQIVRYKQSDSGLLKALSGKLPEQHSLRYPDFVNYYYGTSDYCHLWVVVGSHDDVLGLLGCEWLPYSTPNGEIRLGFGSNFTAFQSGAGGLLFLHWLKNCEFGIVFGGNENTHHILRSQHWVRYQNASYFYFNRSYASQPGEALWKNVARWVLRHGRRKIDVAERARKVVRDGSLAVEVIEENCFTDEMLPKRTAFNLRCAPGIEHLNWRYNTQLDFVRYRVFRILYAGENAGYVVINELPDRVLVAQCDSEDPLVLSQAILAALGVVCGRQRREVLLTSSHTIMQRAFREFGFQRHRVDGALAIGGLKGKPPFPHDTRKWLVNHDWGDNGLRAPFLGQHAI